MTTVNVFERSMANWVKRHGKPATPLARKEQALFSLLKVRQHAAINRVKIAPAVSAEIDILRFEISVIKGIQNRAENSVPPLATITLKEKNYGDNYVGKNQAGNP